MAEKALDFLKSGFVPDLLISDLVLGEMDGIELVEKVGEKLPSLKIMVLSGRIIPKKEARLKELKIWKPLLLDNLSKEIADIFND